MRYLVLACDYDGTLAHHGKVDADTAAALDRLLASGRRLVLVTGRQLDDLARIFPELDRFELVVAENGAVLHEPGTGETKLLAEPPPPAFAQTLAQRGVTPLSVGSVIVATWRPHETTVLEVIRELGLELHVIFNKGAVMVLPSEVNKGSGFLAALATMGLSRHNAVGVGDAENDHTFLSRCECAVAVENALPPLKRRADLVVEKDHGAGVAQLIDQMLKDDLAAHEIARHAILLGTREDGRRVTLGAHGQYILVAGPSGTGKSETTRAILERVQRERYQACTIDPEGDYEGLSTAITIGDSDRAPTAEEVAQLLQQPEVSVIINLLGLRLPQRPAFCASLLPRLISLNGAIGRPHWVVVDEAHHVLPISSGPLGPRIAAAASSVLLATAEPTKVSVSVLGQVRTVIATGPSAREVLASFCRAVGEDLPAGNGREPEKGSVLVWSRGEAESYIVRVTPADGIHRRHRRKYAQGELGPDKSFYFRDAAGAFSLRAQNLTEFVTLAESVDDATWLYHLRSGHYVGWFRDDIKDLELTLVVETIERDRTLTAAAGRSLLRRAIEHRYAIAI